MNRVGKSAVTSAALSVLFLIVYGGCNYITLHRSHVKSYFFGWERSIPFVPAMILPYMSIDLFFVGAPFLAKTDRERRTLAGRIVLAILIAGACFLIHPLRFAFERRDVDGLLGVIFNNFRSLDLPFNEFPSLHIALLVILADIYGRRLKGFLRRLVLCWFVLIGISPVLTFQHHLIDIVGGLALGVLCMYLVDEEPLRQEATSNLRVALYYATGSVALGVASTLRLPWTALLLWPAVSLALTASGYLFLGPGIFRKVAGRHTWSARTLLGPVLIGHRISKAYYARQCRPYDCLTDSVWIGRSVSDHEARALRDEGVTAVLDLAAEFCRPAAFGGVAYLSLPVLDLTAPTVSHVDEAIQFIRQQAEAGIIYIHCKIGYSRTAAVAGAYLMEIGEAESAADAMEILRGARPSIIIRPEAKAALETFEMRIRQTQGRKKQMNPSTIS